MKERGGAWPAFLATAVGATLVWALWRYGATEIHRLYLFFLALASCAVLAALTLPRPAAPGPRHPAVALAGILLLAQIALRPSLAAEGYLVAAAGWAALFLTLRLTAASPRLLSPVAGALVVLGLAEAVLGLAQSLHGESGTLATATGTLINRNHYAGLLNMTLGLALGRAVVGFEHRRRSSGDASETWARTWIEVLGVALLALGVGLSRSRGGFLALLGLFVFVALLRRGRRSRPVLALVLATVLGLGSVFGLDTLLLRFGQSDTGGRGGIYQDTLRLIADHPVLGVGPGTYRFRFRPYQSEVEPRQRFDHAHNDYLETAAEWGVPRASVFWGLVAVLLARAVRRRGRDPRRRALALGSAAAIFAILLHSLVDFNLHVPGNLAVFAVILGLAWNLEAPADRSAPSPRRFAAAADLAVVRILLPLALLGAGWRTVEWSRAHASAAAGDLAGLREAARRDPSAPRYAFRLGLAYRDRLEIRDLEEARRFLERAVEENPYNWRYRLELAWAYEVAGLGDAAEESLRKAVALNPRSGAYRYRLASFYVRRGELAAAAAEAALAAELDPSRLEPCLALMLKSGAGREDLRRLWPSAGGARLRFLRTLAVRGSPDPVAEELLDSLWPELRSAPEPPSFAEASFYFEHLRRRGGDLRREWSSLAAAHGHADPAWEQGENDVWNGGFEAPLAGGLLGWEVSPSQAFSAARSGAAPAAGAFALEIELAGSENLDFQGVRQRALVAPGGLYELSFDARSEELTTDRGVFFQVVGADGGTLFESPEILGTTPWRRYSGSFTIPAGRAEVTLVLRRRPSRRIDNRLAGTLWLDSVALRRRGAEDGA